jgi:hypothetical protein
LPMKTSSGVLIRTLVSGGTDSVSQTLPPITDLARDHGPSAKNGGSRIDDDVVLNGRVPFLVTEFRPRILGQGQGAQRNALIEPHPLADQGGLADHHPGAVVDEEAAPMLPRDGCRFRSGCARIRT